MDVRVISSPAQVQRLQREREPLMKKGELPKLQGETHTKQLHIITEGQKVGQCKAFVYIHDLYEFVV